jgi:membrane protein implicated in regulation of membrane protease activity
MDIWTIWLISGAVMVLLEFIVPGGVIVFLGMAAVIVGGSIYFNWITSHPMAFLAWFIISIILMVFLRSIFIKYFEGDSKIENTDEDIDLEGSLADVIEDILPHKEGRVRFRDSTWSARSDEEHKMGIKVVISGRDGNSLVVKSV